MQKLWGMHTTTTLPSLPGSLWPGVLGPGRVLYTRQIELFNIKSERKQMINPKLDCLKKELFDHLTEREQMTDI